MLHAAPTSETKAEIAQSKTQVVPQPERELHPHLPSPAGLYSPGGMSGIASGGSPYVQRRQALAGMQSAYGNQAVLRTMQSSPHVARMSALRPSQGMMLQRKCACGGSSESEGECAECKEKRESMLQRSVGNQIASPAALPIVHNVLSSSGQSLDAGTRAFMEPRFGHDFSQVRVHTDARAAESAQVVNALAYTVGRDVVFGAGQYAPGTQAGRRMLAHELVHVVQQRDAAPRMAGKLEVTDPADASEQDAERVAAQIDASQGCLAVTPVAPRIARQDDGGVASGAVAGGMVADAAGAASSPPVFFCTKPVMLGQSHAFFRVGGSGPGNPTFELEHDETGDHCPCGIQGWRTRDYSEDKDAQDAPCVPAPTITQACLLSNWDKYPIGKYCALGPNSNTYAHWLAGKCGAANLRPPGRIPGFDDAPPLPGTAADTGTSGGVTMTLFCDSISCDSNYCRMPIPLPIPEPYPY